MTIALHNLLKKTGNWIVAPMTQLLKLELLMIIITAPKTSIKLIGEMAELVMAPG
jgi:hypothetical protein